MIRNVYFGPQLNIIIAGDKSVGKSSLIKSFIINDKDDDGSSVKDRKYRTGITIDNQNFNLIITEQSGLQQPDHDNNNQPHYYQIPNNNHAKTHAQVLIYDIANKPSFEYIKKWVFQNRTGAPTILLANGCDLFPKGIDGKEGILSYGYCRNNGPKSQPEDIMKLCSKYYGAKVNGEEYTKQNNMTYFEVSAKTKMNVNAALKTIAEKAKGHYDINNIVFQSPRMPYNHMIERRPVRHQMLKRVYAQPQQMQQQQQQQYPPQQMIFQQQVQYQQPQKIPPPPPPVYNGYGQQPGGIPAPTPVNNIIKPQPIQVYENVTTKDQSNCVIL